MITFSVRTKGFEHMKAELDRSHRRMTNFKPPLEKAGLLMLRSIDTNFRNAGRPVTWRRLSRRYLIQKLRDRYSPLPLTRTGALRRSISKFVSNNKLHIGTSVKYASIHQLGKGRVSARPFLVFQTEDLNRIERLITRHITEGA